MRWSSNESPSWSLFRAAGPGACSLVSRSKKGSHHPEGGGPRRSLKGVTKGSASGRGREGALLRSVFRGSAKNPKRHGRSRPDLTCACYHRKRVTPNLGENLS